MKKKTIMMAFLFLAGILTVAFGEAIVTSNQEKFQGDILSDTNGVLQISHIPQPHHFFATRRSSF